MTDKDDLIRELVDCLIGCRFTIKILAKEVNIGVNTTLKTIDAALKRAEEIGK